MNEETHRRAYVRGLWALGVTLLTGVALMPSQALAAACSASIGACGCTINKSGSYAVSAATLHSSGPSCIDIVAPKVVLDLKAATIDGNGQTTPTIGIEVDATGPHGTVKNVAIISSTGTAAIEDFGTGIRSAAAATTVGGLDSVDVSSDGRGMVFNGASPVLLNVSADDNMTVGIQLNSGAAGGALVHVDASDNTAGSGIWINGANGTSMTDVTANGNNGIGVWLDGASNNSLVAFNANDNAIAGVFVGCNSAGPDGHTCVSVGRSASNGNSVMGNVAVATRSTADGQKWGVAIGSGNSRNHVVFVEGSGNTIDDGLDENTNCDANVWSLNTFTKTSPSHITPFCIGNP